MSVYGPGAPKYGRGGRNRSGWYAAIPLEDLLGLIEEAQSA